MAIIEYTTHSSSNVAPATWIDYGQMAGFFQIKDDVPGHGVSQHSDGKYFTADMPLLEIIPYDEARKWVHP